MLSCHVIITCLHACPHPTPKHAVARSAAYSPPHCQDHHAGEVGSIWQFGQEKLPPEDLSQRTCVEIHHPPEKTLDPRAKTPGSPSCLCPSFRPDTWCSEKPEPSPSSPQTQCSSAPTKDSDFTWQALAKGFVLKVWSTLKN